MYDIIGDIHGYADELEILLARLEYQRIDGVWQHRERVLISVGDLIDRGPQQKRTVDILRDMAERGFAKVVMGNHEFNAVAYTMTDATGAPFRVHTPKNRHQHLAFLLEAESEQCWYQDTIGWFKQLPVVLDFPEFRVVHACWHPASVAVLKDFSDDCYVLKPAAWADANTKEHPLYKALEVLMKGWELTLPEGYSFDDKDGHRRDRIRTRWWLERAGCYQELAIGVPDVTVLPDVPVSADLMPGYDNTKPLFIGHYWLRGKPARVSERVACVDWSVADLGSLVAYRFNDSRLNDNNFVGISARPDGHFSVELLSEAFYLADPMHTCCVENGCTDEYQNIAAHAKRFLDNNIALLDAIQQALVAAFGPDLIKEHHLCAVLAQLGSLSGKGA